MSLSLEVPAAPQLQFSANRETDFVRFTPTLEPLLDFWATVAEQPDHALHSCAVGIAQARAQYPELAGPLTAEVKQKHAAVIKSILYAVFPAGLQRFSFSAVGTPGTFDIHYSTPRFRQELLDDRGQLRGALSAAALDWDKLGRIFMCLGIARTFYQLDIEFQSTLIYEILDKSSGLKRYFQMRAHFEHVQRRGPKQVEPLTPAQIQLLRSNLSDINVWRKVIPLHLFEMYGLAVFDATEVTEEIVLQSIQQELVAKECLRNRGRLLALQQHLRELLNIADLTVAVPVYHDQQVLVFSPNSEAAPSETAWLENACAFTPSEGCEEYRTSCGLEMCDDLMAEGSVGACGDDLRDMGMRSFMTLPLNLEGKAVGSLVCCSPRPGVFNLLTPTRLNQVLPQLASAAQRTMDAVESKIQSVMKERFTALHPAVEWRFRQDAVSVVRGQENPEEILFANLYPLFGTSDVRDSTVLRNTAIVADLTAQLELADQVLSAAQAARPLAYVDSLRYRIVSWKEQLGAGLNTGDESKTVEFLKHELEPLFDSLRSTGFSVEEAIGRYDAALESRLGLVYEERKLYETSMSLVRETVAQVLANGQTRAQQDYPHYFEMHKTDGVDHTMYIGASLIADGKFDQLFLRNLRLWQLQTMIEVVRKTRDVTRQMELKMETAHLILVQDSPITIRFSLEEKQFNVDGSYNARYEILKKRIDKAEIRENGERLTQPGKLAIVYSHPREAAEYHRYLRYLGSQGLISDQIEDHEVAALQGVSGLRALRIAIV